MTICARVGDRDQRRADCLAVPPTSGGTPLQDIQESDLCRSFGVPLKLGLSGRSDASIPPATHSRLAPVWLPELVGARMA